jgi:hypothetical protein
LTKLERFEGTIAWMGTVVFVELEYTKIGAIAKITAPQ